MLQTVFNDFRYVSFKFMNLLSYISPCSALAFHLEQKVLPTFYRARSQLSFAPKIFENGCDLSAGDNFKCHPAIKTVISLLG